MFNPDKVLQEIIYLLSLNGGRMNLLKIMKELYLIDRESIKERDISVSGDVFCSMPHGPVLSQTLNILNDFSYSDNVWGEYLKKEPTRYYPDIIKKEKDCNFDRLSKKEKGYIKTISDSYKNWDTYKLADYTHKLKEWVDPNGSSRKIRFQDIMRALGKTEKEINEAKLEYGRLDDLCNLKG